LRRKLRLAVVAAFDPINVASLVITTISVGVTIYLFRRSIRKPVPTYSVHPLRVRIVDKTTMTVSGLEVLHNGQPLNAGNLTAVTVYFWNDGREPMRGSQVLTMYTIKIVDPNVRILDWKVTPLREESKFSIPNGRPSPNSIHLLFEIVENSFDAAEIQIMYSGDPNAAISMTGVIEGANEPKRKDLDDVRGIASFFADSFFIVSATATFCIMSVMLLWVVAGHGLLTFRVLGSVGLFVSLGGLVSILRAWIKASRKPSDAAKLMRKLSTSS
jgi:hypothetical protein